MKKSNGKKILVPLDGSKNSERALKHAMELATQTNMSIIGFHVLPIPLLSAVWRPKEVKNAMFDQAQKIMSKIRKMMEKKGIGFEEKIESGIPGTNIVTFAGRKKNKVSLIVIGSKSRGVSKEKYFGSLSNYVLHKSKIPVMIV